MDERGVRRNREAAERLDEITREGYRSAVDQAFEAQKSGMRLSRRFFETWVETLDDHAELHRRTSATCRSWSGNSVRFSRSFQGVGRRLRRFPRLSGRLPEEISRFDKRPD